MKKILILFLFVVSIQIEAQIFPVNNFENDTDNAYVAWNGSCQIIDNPLSGDDNNSSRVLKVISEDYAPVGFPLSLPDNKTLSDYIGIRFQVAILEEIPENSIHWVGFELGISENQHSIEIVGPAEGTGAAWEHGEVGKWYTVELSFNTSLLKQKLQTLTSDQINMMIKLGRRQFIYVLDNIELIEKTPYVGDDEQNYYGVNLSGAEFGGIYPGVEGTHYGYPTYKDLDYFKSKNLNLIRFPFRWERIQHTMYGELHEASLAKMKTFVSAAEDRGMPVIIDMHNFARYSFDGGTTHTLIGTGPSLTKEHLADVWIKLATEFKNYSNIWGYDIMNEPYGMDPAVPWVDIAQTVINAIRTVDTETPIIISGDGFSSAQHWVHYSDNLRTLIDPNDNLIFQAHIYFDKDTSGAYKYSYDEEGATPQTGVNRVRPFVEWLRKYNKRGLLGEYGVPDDDSRWLVTLENMLEYLKENGVPGTYWSAGPRWGDYHLAVQPTNNYTVDRPQMSILEKYTVTNDNPTGLYPINKPSAEETQIRIEGNKVRIIAGEDDVLSVYNILGICVKKINLYQNKQISFSLPAGIYIINNRKYIIQR